ncbi:oxygen-independent coproporphyrinogen III oxidase [uncultured Abyssibacter sp.]|uniref:oxygen-independent coproporphyrinogen III oxidase n=1 Tax=uncultured Abyssibacter sp. TaxID=2320202 RepID=UPI0032B2F799
MSKTLFLPSTPLDLQAMRAPRYTSYPTALQFCEEVGPTDAIEALRASNDDLVPAPLSLYLHVPFCRSNCFYCGCTRTVTRNQTIMSTYAARLCDELVQRAENLDRDRRTVQVHFGGGTPNHLPDADLERIVGTIRQHYRVVSAVDASLEVDPRLVQANQPAFWRRLGFNRISIGVQDVDPRVQRLINRIQPSEMVAATVDACRDAGFASINFDLVYGLPGQTLDSINATMDFVEQQRPDRVAAFGYAHLPERLPAQRAINRAWLPDPQARFRMRNYIESRLIAAGYVAIGLDHFALPTDTLAQAFAEGTLHRNFQGYTTHAGCDIIGFGVSSISRVGRVFAQNTKALDDYASALERHEWPIERGYRQSDEDRLRERVIMGLMCHRPVDLVNLSRHYQLDAEELFADALDNLHAIAPRTRPLTSCHDGVLEVTEAGRPYLRLIAAQFDAYLNTTPSKSSLAV